MRSRHITVSIRLEQVRANAERIRRTTGVPLIAVVKADAYGLGAPRVADALAGVADDLAYFSIHEAREVGRPGLIIGPPEGEPAEYRELGLRPSVFTLEDAERFAGLPVAVSLDTGMQRFGCPPERLDDLLRRSTATELFTHAQRAQSASMLRSLARGLGVRLHAASSALLSEPDAWLDAVRPGVALYRGAVRVSTRLVCVRESRGPAGYGGFDCPRFGIILAGYAHHLAPAAVLINGRRQRLLEVGMNSAYVSVDAADRVGDEVVLLGASGDARLGEAELAGWLHVREHELLCRYTSMGLREYSAGDVVEPRATPQSGDLASALGPRS